MTYSAVVRACALAALGLFAACGAPAPRTGGPEALTNAFLGPSYSQWLVGAVARMATPQEVQGYLALQDDFAAADFIEAFWRLRDPDPAAPGNPLRETFDQRAEDADRSFSEAGYLGRRTARGLTFILYGKPSESTYAIAPDNGPAIEVWAYAAGSPPGLDGKPPAPVYRFRKLGDVTTFYRPTPVRPGRRPASLP